MTVWGWIIMAIAYGIPLCYCLIMLVCLAKKIAPAGLFMSWKWWNDGK